MKDIKTEILKEFREKFVKGFSASYVGAHDVQEGEYWVQAEIEDLEQFLSTSLDQVREQTLEEVEKEVINSVEKTYHNFDGFYHGELLEFQRKALTKLKGEKSE